MTVNGNFLFKCIDLIIMLDELKYSFKNVSAYGSKVTVSRYNHVHQIAI